MSQSPAEQQPDLLRSVHTNTFTELLKHFACSIAITTYQAGRLVIARADGEVTNTHFRIFDKPMGMAVDGPRIALGTACEIITFRNVPAAANRISPPGSHDACYLPTMRHITGDIDVHEMAWIDGQPWFINTRFSCLCTLGTEGDSFTPCWRPPFISGYDLRDRCHLNGLAVRDGQARYITALGESDDPAGWRKHKANGGILMDISNNAFLLRGLSMPHSPRWYQDRLWFLESGRGALCWYDPKQKKTVTIAELPGFTRGLDFLGNYALIGLSQVRESAVFAGLPLTTRQPVRYCGVWVVDINNGDTVAFLRFEEGVQEIFAVNAIGGRFPDVILDDPALVGGSYVLSDEVLKEAVQPDNNWDSAEQHFEKGNQCYQQQDVEGAMREYRKALELQDDFIPARFNLGVILGDLDRYDEAIPLLRQVVEADAAHADAHNSLGYLHSQMGKHSEAIEWLEKTLKIAPNHAQAHHNLGLVLLRTGDFPRGFSELEWRWRTPGFQPFSPPHPRWDGSLQKDQTLLLHTEQGAGDTFQMARFIPWAAERVKDILLLAPTDMHELFTGLPGVKEIRGAGDLASASFDCWLPMMSLPLLYGLQPDNIPVPELPYLHLPERAAYLLPDNGRPKIGICWSGNPTQGQNRFRSTGLSNWLPLLAQSNYDWYSLQKGEVAEAELETIGADLRPENLAPHIGNWGDTALLLQQLDLLICVDTGIAHLAGTLGVPVWTLVYKSADWRYPQSGEKMPWYPTMRLFHQQRQHEWAPVIEAVRQSLSSNWAQTTP